jgi:hypothetical protein
MQIVHTEDEVHAEQFKVQTMHEPPDKYLPVSQVEHYWVVDKVHVKQLFDGKQHSFVVVNE